MAMIEGFRVRNYRVLRDVTLGRPSGHREHDPLTPFTVVIGKNGSGKSSLFDAGRTDLAAPGNCLQMRSIPAVRHP